MMIHTHTNFVNLARFMINNKELVFMYLMKIIAHMNGHNFTELRSPPETMLFLSRPRGSRIYSLLNMIQGYVEQ